MKIRARAVKSAQNRLMSKKNERNHLEALLQEEAEVIDAFLRYSHYFVYRHDNQGVFDYLSLSVESLTGYSVEEWKTHYTTYMTDHPENQKVIEYTEKALKEGVTCLPYPVQIRHKDGRLIWLEVDERPQIVNGRAAGIIGIAKDITVSKERQNKLHLLSSTVEQSMDGLAVANMDGHIQWVNKAFARMHDYTVEEVMGKNLTMFHSDDQLAQVEKVIKEIKQKGHFFGEIWHKRRDGTVFPGLMLNTLLRDEDGRGIGIIGTLRDITDMKEHEEALKYSEAKFRGLFDNMSSGVVVYEACQNGEDFRIVDFNKAAQKIENIRKEEVIGQNVTECFPGIKAFGLLEVIKSVWQTGVPEHFPISLYKDDRIQGWRENFVYKLDSGEVVAVYDDVTARKQMEESLQKSEREHRETVDSLLSGVVVYDANTNVLLSNPEASEILGLTADQMLSRQAIDPAWKFVDENLSFLKAEDYPVRQVISTKKPLNNHVLGIVRPDRDDIAWVNVSARPLFCADGQLSRVVVNFVDITRQKTIEVALRKSEERFQQVAANAQEWIWEINTEGLFRYASSVIKEILGYPYQDIVGVKYFYDLFYPEDLASQKETFDQILKEKKNFYNFTHKNIHQNGSFVWLSSSGMPMFDEAGHFIGFRGSDINITLRMRIMEELELAKQKAEEATRLKDKFVSLVAHDLKSPMASILGFIRLIRTSAKNALSEKEQKMLSMTQDSAERMIAMVEELLDISRLQSGVIKLLKTFVDGHKIGLLVQASLGYLAADKGIRIENLVPSGTRLYADPSLFVEVISNLVLNAIKFSKSGSTVKIYVPSAEKRSILAVSDTGVGVPDYIQENIFNHAQKTNTLGTAGERGTGLGLPYSYEIMKAHQGSLTFETVAGQGSVFYAELPVTEPRVLLVERDALVRYNYKAQLDAIGAKSFEADCAAAALDLLEKTMPHLIVMDILMPDMEGQDFLKRVKSSSQTLHIPVIVISSNTAHHVREQILEIGAEDFCDHKPIGIEEFTGRVRKYIV